MARAATEIVRVIRRFEEYAEVLATDLSVAVEEVHDAGEQQCALVLIAGTAFGSGAPHEHLWGYVAGVQDGRVIFVRAYYDAAAALRAVGLEA
jgi:ketosteroid isomerase-like protein